MGDVVEVPRSPEDKEKDEDQDTGNNPSAPDAPRGPPGSAVLGPSLRRGRPDPLTELAEAFLAPGRRRH